MTITTVDGIVAGGQALRSFAKSVTATLVAGRPASLWALAGSPGAGGYDTTANGAVLSSSSAMVNGQIPHVDPVSGNAYLASFLAMSLQAGVLQLCDRLWQSQVQSSTSTSAQTLTTPTWPARDNAQSTNGDGVLIATEVSAAMGAGTPTLTLSYTNQAGTASRSAVNLDPVVASAAIGAFERFGLQAGDTGVRSIASITASATRTSGTYNLVAYRVLASLALGAGIPNSIDAVLQALQRIPNGAVPFLMFIPSTTTAVSISGHYIETQG